MAFSSHRRRGPGYLKWPNSADCARLAQLQLLPMPADSGPVDPSGIATRCSEMDMQITDEAIRE
jgi:hypothetical protein